MSDGCAVPRETKHLRRAAMGRHLIPLSCRYRLEVHDFCFDLIGSC